MNFFFFANKIISDEGHLKLVLKLFNFFDRKRKIQIFQLLFLMLISTAAEVSSIGAVFPFIAMLTAPQKLFYHPYLKEFNFYFKIHSPTELLLPITIIYILFILIAVFFRISLLWFTGRVTSSFGTQLSTQVFKKLLYQPYSFHIKTNSSEIINTISHKINSVIFSIFFPFLTLINSIFLLLAILISLLIIEPLISVCALMILGFSYIFIARIVRYRVKEISKISVENQSKLIKVIQESIGGIRDIILNWNQELYLKIYKDSDTPLRKSTATYNYLTQFPRYAMESIAIIVIALLAFYLACKTGNISKVLPIIGVLAIGAQRLLPVLQQIYSNWISIIGNHKQLTDVLSILEYSTPNIRNMQSDLVFSRSIKFDNISFQYSTSSPLILKQLNLLITKGSRVGLIGATGSGKSTLLDVMMGLLCPSSGNIIIDDKVLNRDDFFAWQSNIAHVPQSIFLSDSSIAENIAFGVPKETIDYNMIKIASDVASISDFISTLPNGYKTLVGERGINLSGGQRQRIGIARAIYRKATVLIFDEATSALDNKTESEVMEAIYKLDRNLTLIIIAHRLTSLKKCDYIIEIENSQIIRHEIDDLFKSKSNL